MPQPDFCYIVTCRRKHRRHSINSDSEDEAVTDSKGKGKAQPHFKVKVVGQTHNRIKTKPKAEPKAVTAVQPPPILDVNPWAKPTSVPAPAKATQAEKYPAIATGHIPRTQQVKRMSTKPPFYPPLVEAPQEVEATKTQALALDLEPEATDVVTAPEQEAAEGLLFARQMHDVQATVERALAALQEPVPVLGPIVETPPLVEAPQEAEASQSQALAVDLEPEATNVVTAPEQAAAAEELLFASQMHDVHSSNCRKGLRGRNATACLPCVCPVKTYMTVTGVSMQAEVPVLMLVPKEQRDLAYWEAQFQKADKLFSAGSALEAIATHGMSLLQQAAGPSTAAEGQ